MSGSIRPSEELCRQSWQNPICPTYFSPPFPHVLTTHSFQHHVWTNIHTFPHNSLRERCPDLLLGGWVYLRPHVSKFPPLRSHPRQTRFFYGKIIFKNSCCLSFSFTHGLSFCCTHTDTHRAVSCGEWLTYAIQLAGYFCLCEWAAVSLRKLWAQQWKSCESQSLTSSEIPSLHPTARWLIWAKWETYFIIRQRSKEEKHI